MMSGIISDTLFLSSPTTTPLEKTLLEWLSPIAGIEPEKLAERIFSSGSVILNSTAQEVINSDCKDYQEGEIRYSVSQIEELGFDNFNSNASILEDALQEHRKSSHIDLSFLLITDVNSHDSILLVSGNEVAVSHINYPQYGKSSAYLLSGVVSRKKQLIPYISGLLKTSGLV